MRKLLFGVCVLVLTLGFGSALYAQGGTLTFGQAVSGTITDAQPGASYTFEGTAGEVVYIAMTPDSWELPTELQLTGPGGALLGRVEENFFESALIGPLALPADGVYTVLATRPSYGQGREGSFALLVDRVEMTPITDSSAVLSGSIGQISQINFYQFSGEKGDIIRYDLEGAAMGIWFRGPSGASFWEDGLYDNPGRWLQVLPETGDYTVAVTSMANSAYTLTLDSGIQPQPLAGGEVLSGSISEDAPLVFHFTSAASKMWRLDARVQGANYNTSLAVYLASSPEYSIAWDSSSGPDNFPRIEPFIAPEDGGYYVVLAFDNYQIDSATSTYEISLSPSTLLSLSPGAVVKGSVSVASGNAIYAYNGTSGEVIRLTLNRTSETGWPAVSVYSQGGSGQIFGMSAYTAAPNLRVDLVLPDTGLYLFYVTDQDYAPETGLDFSISIEPAP